MERTQTDERSLWESKIELGEKFFEEIIQHPIPLDINTLTALKRSSLGLDLYLWLTYRTFALKRPLRLPWPTLYRQFGVDLFSVNYFGRSWEAEIGRFVDGARGV